MASSDRSASSGDDPREERHELQERLSGWLDAPLTILALVSVVLLIVELALELGPPWPERIGQVQTAIWIIFGSVFAIELFLAPSKLRYLRTHWITTIAVLLPAFRVVRVFRAAAALRGLSLARILTTLNRGSRALGQVAQRGQFGYVAGLTLGVTLTAAAGVYYFERGVPAATIRTPGEALWWAATIITTINSPLEATTLEGRIIGILLRVFALAISGYLTAMIAVHLLGGLPAQGERTELAEIRDQLGRLERRLVQQTTPDPDTPRTRREIN